jgi:predicted DNA-binding protein (MmcQ/YjbR family)
MTSETRVQEVAAARASELPGAAMSRQATGDWRVWKVGGKNFMLETSMPGEPVAIIKADPADGESLRQTYTSITPGYHSNKKHWITLGPGDELSDDLIGELVIESYTLVVEGLPAAKRPVDPTDFRAANTIQR